MYERRWLKRSAVTAVLLLVGGPVAVRAQSQAEYRARVQALVPAWRRLTVLKHYEDSVQASALPKDTVRISPLTVLVDSSLMSFGREVTRAAAARVERRFGASVSALKSHLYALTPVAGRSGTPDTVQLTEVDSAHQSHFIQSQVRDPRLVGNALVHWGAMTLTAELGPEFATWLGGELPVDTANAGLWAAVRIDLVTSSARMAGKCYAGADSACAMALGVLGTEDPVVYWYDAAERKVIVEHLRMQMRTDHETQYQRCTIADDDSACVALLRLLPNEQIEPPLGTFSRQSLVRLALDMGGKEALARMLRSPDRRDARLAAAAGVPVDSLIGMWRRAVVSTHVANPSVNWGLVLSSCVWILVCGAFGMRSSPWR